MNLKTLKALSLYEPYASLCVTGAKRYETRAWGTDYRGPLLICAVKAYRKKDVQFLLDMPAFQGGLAPLVGKELDWQGQTHYGVTLDHLNFGKALGIVEIVNCIPTFAISKSLIQANKPFSDFCSGWWAWEFKLIMRFSNPFPFRGRQGIFEVQIAENLLK